MRLAAKPFLISLLVIVVLATVGFLSFYAVGNLVSVNREIATRTVPAMRLAGLDLQRRRDADPPRMWRSGLGVGRRLLLPDPVQRRSGGCGLPLR